MHCSDPQLSSFAQTIINTQVTYPVPGTPALDIGAPPPRPIDDIRGRWADVPGALYAVIKGFAP